MKSFILLVFFSTSPNNSSSGTSTSETGSTKEQAAKIIQELQMILNSVTDETF